MEWLPRMIIVMGHVRWAFHGFSVLSAKDYWLLHFIFTAKRSKRLYWETLFNGITLYLPSLSEFNYDSFLFFFLSYFLVFSVKWNLYMAISLPLINFHPYKDEISIFQSTIIIMKFEFKTLHRLLKLLSLLES